MTRRTFGRSSGAASGRTAVTDKMHRKSRSARFMVNPPGEAHSFGRNAVVRHHFSDGRFISHVPPPRLYSPLRMRASVSDPRCRMRRLLLSLLVLLPAAVAHAEPLPGTKPLTREGDLAAQMVE